MMMPDDALLVSRLACVVGLWPHPDNLRALLLPLLHHRNSLLEALKGFASSKVVQRKQGAVVPRTRHKFKRRQLPSTPHANSPPHQASSRDV